MLDEIVSMPITEIIFDEELYPRGSVDWMVSHQYKQAMDAGAIFPPIVLALLDSKYVLVDGKHRLDAHKSAKLTTIKSRVLGELTREQIFVEAIKANATHGRQLDSLAKVKIITKLLEWNYAYPEISKITNLPISDIQMFQARTMTNSLTGKPIALKASLEHLHGTQDSGEIADAQGVFAARSQEQILRQAIALFKLNLLDKQNTHVLELFKELKRAIREYKLT